MTEPTVQPERLPPSAAAPPPGRWARGAVLVALAASAALVATVGLYYLYFPSQIGAAEPLPFSHRFHAGEKQINCLFCHAGATDGAHAEIPPLETCMLCHRRIIVAYPQVAKLREYSFSGVPVEWQRVNHLQEFVYFNHAAHLQRGVDCSKCHGDVKAMDRLEPAPEFTMGFCVQCHRDENVSHDCLICHR